MMIKQILSVIAVLWSVTHLVSQSTDWNTLIGQWREEYHVPGLSVGIIQDGKVIHAAGYGVLEEGKTKKADQHTLYAIASNTKAFISAAIATLVDEGKLDWDDPVRKYLPYFELYDPCVSEMTTIRDLLCHRTGLGTFSGDAIWYRSTYSAEEIIKRADEIPKDFEFRNGYGYSNVMYITAGEIIRVVTGKNWDQYVRETFLDPLGMNTTVTGVEEFNGNQNVATPHSPAGDKNTPIDWVPWEGSGAAGGIIASVDDMLKWMSMQINKGIANGDTFFTSQQQMTMWTTHVSYPVSDRTRELFGRNFNGYGLGWGTTEYQGKLMISHTGGYDGMYSAVVLLPKEKIGVVVLTNTMRAAYMMLAYEIMDKLLGVPQKDWKQRGMRQDSLNIADRESRIQKIKDHHVTGTTPTMKADEIKGLYRCPMYGDIRIESEGEQLYIHFTHAPDLRARLSHWHYDTYVVEWLKPQSWFSFGTVQIVKDNNQKAASLQFDIPNDDIFFEEIHAVKVGS